MIPPYETAKRKAETKKYVDVVIDKMSLADSDLKKIISRDIKELIEVSLTYADLGKSFHFSAHPELEKEVNRILDQLRTDIFNIIYARAESTNNLAFEKEKEEKHNKFLLLLLTSAFAGKTLETRIDEYVRLMRSEIEAYIAAGMFAGLSRTQILLTYLTWIKKPYSAPLLLNAFKTKGFKAERIVSKGLTFGTGKYISAFNNLIRLQQQTVFQAYNYTINSIWLNNSRIVGWYTVRGSSYPCSICDDNIGIFHPKEEFFFGYHVRCCCIMLPVYIGDFDNS